MIARTEEDVRTANHQQRVADFAREIAEEMGLVGTHISAICMAALVHDIGKTWLRAEVLSKPTELTQIEFGIVRAHAETGYKMCKAIRLPSAVGQMVLQHHERMDGSGYPQGLAGEDIVLGARILAVADVVEAMASPRPYRPAYNLDEALGEITRNKGTLYDPDVVDACLKVFRERLLASAPEYST
jgi:putative nucleotidyltransferase with HDIG domain